MHKCKYKYKYKLKPLLTAFLCLFLINSTTAFQVSGSGNNLRIVQTKYAKSANFQINAKLKPTARVIAKTNLANTNSSNSSSNTPNPTPTPNTNYSDGSSPHTGTANWSKVGRSKRVTEELRLAKLEAEKLKHTSAPKEISDNLKTQIIDDNNKKDVNREENSEKSKISRDFESTKKIENKNYNPQKDNFVVANDGQVILNPTNFTLRFSDDEIIPENPAKKLCQKVYINNFYQADYWYPIAKSLFIIVICLTLLIFCLAILVYRMLRNKDKKNPAKKSRWQKFLKLLPILFLIVAVTSENASAGPVTTPQELIYEGDLLDNAGNPLTGSYSFRFSLWDNQDFEASDVINGSINTTVPDYYNWQEVQTQNLVNGKFSLKLGSVTPFFAGLFDHTNMYLQVEVKNASDPDTSYELIDLDQSNPNIDRTVIDTIPFAFNADKLDFRDTGYGPGEIPYIDSTTGKLPASIIEASAANAVGGVDGNTFTLDLDGNANVNDNLVLKFGDILNKTLAWNGTNQQFEFNDNVKITGNLVVTGTINGQSLGIKNKIEVLSPRYPNSIIDKDGSDNSGAMYEELENINGVNKNILRWTSKKSNLQDYDIVIRYTLPANFAGFQSSNPVSFDFKTDGNYNDAKVDLIISKESSSTDELQGAGIGFNANSWTTVDLNLNPNTTWSANETMLIKLKMYARNNLNSRVGDIILKFNEN